jgi:hypothetical protein
LVAFANLGVTIAHPYLKRRYGYRPFRLTSLSVAVVNSVILTGAGLAAYFAMQSSEYSNAISANGLEASDVGNSLGPGLPLVFAGAFMKFASIPIIGFIAFIIVPIIVLIVAAILSFFGLKLGLKTLQASAVTPAGEVVVRRGLEGGLGFGGDGGGGGSGWRQYESTQYEVTPTQPESYS